MRSAPFRLRAADGVELYVHHFAPDSPAQVRATLQIVHGMGEHAARYERLAWDLCADGFEIYAADCRGHGLTAPTKEDLGHFADADGWEKVIADVHVLRERVTSSHASLPHVLFGHSMGSILALDYLTRFGSGLAACVLSGSAPSAGPLGWAMRALAYAESLRLGARGHSAVLQSLLFGGFNKSFEPAETPFDWLSRDRDEVARYVADPLCGFVLTAGSLSDLAAALPKIHRVESLRHIPRALPLYLIAGEKDPVGGLVGVTKLADELRRAGLERVELRIYPSDRHELLNEVDRRQVTDDLRGWLRIAVFGS